MSVQEQRQESSGRQPVVGKVLGESILVAVVGALLALTANQISPKGLKLTRDYFPQAEVAPTQARIATNNTPTQTATNEAAPPSEAESAITRIKAKGLQVVSFDEVKKLLHDPGFQNGSIIFIDARGDEYQAGHIPGAYQLDYFHPDKYLLTVLPACQNASRIVVYCSSAECDLGEMTAVMLRDGGVPNEKLFVYSGGMAEWDDKKEPIETGARNSGQMLPTKK